MDYLEAMSYLKSLQKFGIQLGLKRMESLLKKMGNPQENLSCLHIAGTNGKGSVAAMIASMCGAAGWKTGLFTSPALQRFNERIKINGLMIQDHQIADILTGIHPLVGEVEKEGEQPTEFEVVTAAAFEYFHRKGVDLAVFEVGLGGRLDSTNVIKAPLVSVITTVGLDHTQILGHTIEQIAGEKAGIIKEKGDVVSGVKNQEARSVIEKKCKEQLASLFQINEHIKGVLLRYEEKGQYIAIETDRKYYDELYLPLLGSHQLDNALLAVKAVELISQKGFTVTKETVRKGLASVCWPGRMEIMQKNPTVIIDGAHNLDGARALKKGLEDLYPEKSIFFVLGILEDKNWPGMIEVLMSMASQAVAVSPTNVRALDSHDLQKEIKRHDREAKAYSSVQSGIEAALAEAKPDEVICIAGSLSTAAEAKSFFEKEKGKMK